MEGNRYYFISVNDAVILTGIINTFLIPIVVAFLKQCRWPDWGKWLLAVVVTVVLGYLNLVMFDRVPNGASVVFFISLLLNASQTAYQFVLRPLGIDARISRLFEFTDKKPPVVPEPPKAEE